MRWALLVLLVGCGAKDGRPNRETSDTSGTPVGATTPTGSTVTAPLGTPRWAEVLQDDVYLSNEDQHHPTHARALDGSSLFLWDQEVGSETHVLVHAYGPDHEPLGDVQLIGQNGSTMARPDGDALQDGTYAAIWHTRFDVFTRKTDVDGTPLGTEVLVNVVRGVDPDKGQPDLAVLTDGSVIEVYHFSDPTSDPVGTYWMRRYDADLVPITDELPVATSQQVGSPPDVVALPDGGWVIGWSTRDELGGTLHLTWYDPDGAALQTVRADETAADVTPSRPNLAAQPDGTVAVTWRVQDNDGTGLGVYGRLYGASHAPITGPFEIQIDSQRPSVAAGPGLFLFTWEPPNSNRIKARAYDQWTGEPLEDPWEPFGGNDDQHRPQASFHRTDETTWDVVFSADRGPLGSRNLARGVWTLTFDSLVP